jgi:dihydrofolate reductase
MSSVIVTNHVTLDGVMQSPAHPDEDRRGGFEHGGWAPPYGDSVMVEAMAEGIARGGALLLGRRTYEHMASFWPNAPKDNPYTEVINQRRKYVASTTLAEPLAWSNSTLLDGDAADAVARLKEQSDEDLGILGSGELIRSLMRRDLIDRYVLTIHPLVLGSGRRLFTDGGAYAALELVDVKPTTTDVLIATYQPREDRTLA